MLALMGQCKSIVITGHSIGGTIASLAALWLLSHIRSNSSSHSVLCITFGSPLLGNRSLSRAILRERLVGNFCHVASKHDIMPRLLFAPLASLSPQLNFLLQYWHICMASPQFGDMALQFHEEERAEFFRFVLACVETSAEAPEGLTGAPFWPFGNYFFCSDEGAICIDNATSVVRLLHLMLRTSSPNLSIKDHLRYGDYIGKVSLQFLNKRSFIERSSSESSYEAGVTLALASLGLPMEESVIMPAKDCLMTARQMGRTPNLNSAYLAIRLSKIAPYRAEIEWYKAKCDESDDQLGYYDTFKLQRASKRDFKVNKNRLMLASFWDSVIAKLENNELPYDFERRAKWVNTSQFYKLLVEPLDIAEYYRTGMHRIKGHYIAHGRARRHTIFDRWWKERETHEEENIKRTTYAGLTQDTCFWAKVEEAREWLDNVRTETDIGKLTTLWDKIDNFEKYARNMIDNKEVSKDVLAKNSSYSLWVEEWNKLKPHLQWRPTPVQFTGVLDEEMVP